MEGLLLLGVTGAVAEQLAKTRPEQVQNWLNWFPYAAGVGNPAAFIVNAIRGCWPCPPAYETRRGRRPAAVMQARYEERREEDYDGVYLGSQNGRDDERDEEERIEIRAAFKQAGFA